MRRLTRIWGIGLTSLAVMGCSIPPLHVKVQVPPLQIQRVSQRVALILPEESKTWAITWTSPCAITGLEGPFGRPTGGPVTVPIGAQVEEGALQALAQAFTTVEVVRGPVKGSYDLLVELNAPIFRVQEKCRGVEWFSATAEVMLKITLKNRQGEGPREYRARASDEFQAMAGWGFPVENAIGRALGAVFHEMAKDLASKPQRQGKVQRRGQSDSTSDGNELATAFTSRSVVADNDSRWPTDA